MNNIDTIHALRSAAAEIQRLRQEVIRVKAEAYEMHSAVVGRLLSRDGSLSVCPAHLAERIASEIEAESQSIPRPPCTHRRASVADGEGCCLECGAPLDYNPETRNWEEAKATGEATSGGK